MSISRGFECDVFVYKTTGGWKKVHTIADIQFTCEKTNIEVANRSCNTKRVLSGLESFNINLEIQKGVDPNDSTLFDAFSAFKTAYEADTPLYLNFGGTLSGTTLSGGRSEEMLITSFSESAPLDGIYTASVSMGISAKTGAEKPTGNTTQGDPQPQITGDDDGSGSGSGE